jgi:hypothetical protein
MKTVLEFPYKVSLRQGVTGRFIVTYGNTVKRNLSYAQAAVELGASLMHAATQNGDASSIPEPTKSMPMQSVNGVRLRVESRRV